MEDQLKHTVELDDYVAFCLSNHNGTAIMAIGKVVGFTPKNVKVHRILPKPNTNIIKSEHVPLKKLVVVTEQYLYNQDKFPERFI